jgi:S1-C subfamily serine protease
VNRRGTAALLAATIVGIASAQAGDAPKPDPYAVALAHARAIEQELVTTVDAACDSSVAVLNDQIPPERPGLAATKPATREPQTVAIGSGTIVKTGSPGAWKIWILTNHHVVDGAAKIEVITRDGVKRPVELVDEVKQFDISLLRFTEKADGLKAVPVRAKASADLEEGQWCIATGNPFGLAMDGKPVVTLGVVSGKDRILGGALLYGRAIQHDAAVNHGNSGGALWNVRGEYLGINGMIASDGNGLASGQQAASVGASFSIPVDEIDAFLARLTDPKKDARAGFLGLATETDTDKAGKPVGARVTAVDALSPASGAKGLQVKDVIDRITINRPEGSKSYVVNTESDVINTLSLCPVGTKLTISFHRGGKQAALTWSGELGSPK